MKKKYNKLCSSYPNIRLQSKKKNNLRLLKCSFSKKIIGMANSYIPQLISEPRIISLQAQVN
jgi:hypothetical protein